MSEENLAPPSPPPAGGKAPATTKPSPGEAVLGNASNDALARSDRSDDHIGNPNRALFRQVGGEIPEAPRPPSNPTPPPHGEATSPSVQITRPNKSSSEPGAKRGVGSELAAPVGRDAPDRRLVYRPSDTRSLHREEPHGWRAERSERFELAAQDALDRDRRIVFLVSRSEDRAQTRAFAAMLGAGSTWERSEGGGSLGTARVEDFLDAVDAARTDDDDGERVFLDLLSATAVSSPLVSAARRRGDVDRADGETDLQAALAERRARLVLLVVAEVGQSILHLLEDLPEAVIVPWTGAWLTEFARRRRQVESELQRVLGPKLRDAATITDASSGEREAVLHLLLLRLETRDDIVGHDRIVREIEGIVDTSRTGMPELGTEARQIFDEVFDTEYHKKWGGPIARTILVVALLVPNRPALAVFELCRWLLPEGPALTACLTPRLIETWRRNADDDVRLGLPVRAPPGWESLYSDIRDRIAQDIGLQKGPDGNLVPGPKLAGLDLEGRLREQTGLLMELSLLVRERNLLVVLPGGLVPVMVDLALALHRIEGGYLDREGLALFLAGMKTDSAELALPRTAVDAALTRLDPALRARIHHVGDLTGLYAEITAAGETPDDDRSHRERLVELLAEAEELEDIEEGLRTAAAGHVRWIFEIVAADPRCDGAFLADLVRVVTDRVPASSKLTLLAYLVLYGPRLATPALGRATLETFTAIGRMDFTDTFRQFRAVFGRMMRGAAAAGRHPPAVDAWADAIWSVAKYPQYRPWGAALGLWFDDSLSTWEIPTTAQEPFVAPMPNSLMPFLGIRPNDEGSEGRSGPDLIVRLFRYTPEERISALVTLAERASGPREASAPAIRPEDLLAQRVWDVFWIMLEEVDREESDRRLLRRDHIENLVWGTASGHYGLTSTLGTDSVIAEITARIGTSFREGRSDPRDLLDLYAPAVLMFWRFHRFGTRPILAGTPEFDAYQATLLRIRTALDTEERLERARRAIGTLVEVEKRLVAHFETRCCERTQARHRERLTCWTAVAKFFDPPRTSLVPIR